MLRTMAKFPLCRLLSKATVAHRPALATAVTPLSHICEFSTKSSVSVHKKDKKKDTDKHERKQEGSELSRSRQQRQRQEELTPWDRFSLLSSGFDDVFARDPFFAPFFKSGSMDPFEQLRQDMLMMPVLRSPSSLLAESGRLVRASPGYEIKESDNAYEIALDIPKGLDTKDLQVELERDGTVVHVTGQRHTEADGVESTTHFSKRFSIGKNVDTEQIKANFSDGCLVICAPKLQPAVQNKRQIPISTEPFPEMTDEEVRQQSFKDEFDESDWAETGKNAA